MLKGDGHAPEVPRGPLLRSGTGHFDEQLTAWERARLHDDSLPANGPEQPGQPIWQALSLLARERSEYLQALEEAYAEAVSDEDRRLACAVSMVAALVDHGTMSHLDVWLARVPDTDTGQASSPVTEIWLALGDVAAAVLHGGQVDAHRASSSASRLFELLDSSAPTVGADTRIMAAQLLLEYGFTVGRFELLDLVVSLVEGPDVMTRASPAAKARWFSCRGYLCFMRADSDGAKRCWQQAHAIAQKARLRGAAFMAQIGLARQLLDEHDVSGADEVLIALRPAEGPGRSNQVLVYKHVVARSLLLKGQPSAAMVHIDEALDAAKLLGTVDGELFLLMQQKAEILFATGRHSEAEAQIEWMMERSKDTDRRIHGINLHLLKALGSLSDRHAEKVEALLVAFGSAREWNFSRFLRSLPASASQACLDALNEGIEVSFVTDTIRQRRLRAPPAAGARWPWHMHVRTMGHAEVRVGGQPLTFAGKAQSKPLELLYFLASSRGLRASNELIASSLWSDEDMAKATKSLETTTGRLRKLLGEPSLVQVAQSQTSLDAQRVWSDWTSLVEIASKVAAFANAAGVAARGDTPALANDLLAVYDGPFLASFGDAPWLMARRREATRIFVAAAIAIHATWPARNVSESVEAFLESALTHEPLSEGIALTLMKVYAASDRVADALRVFRHLRHQMSVLLGLKPGKSIDDFAQQLLSAGR